MAERYNTQVRYGTLNNFAKSTVYVYTYRVQTYRRTLPMYEWNESKQNVKSNKF